MEGAAEAARLLVINAGSSSLKFKVGLLPRSGARDMLPGTALTPHGTALPANGMASDSFSRPLPSWRAWAD